MPDTLKPDNIDVVILCGGMGKRLKGVVSDRPKPMAEIEGKPFLDILIEYVSGFRFRRFILCTGYKGDMIKDHYEARSNAEFLFSMESEPLGTGGAIKNAESLIRSNPFLVMNGDSFCSMDMLGFLGFHASREAVISIALVAPEGEPDYGAVILDRHHGVLSFSEKAESTSYINAGVYLFDSKVLGLIRPGRSSLEYDLFPNILDKGVYGYVTDGILIDIGTPARYERAKREEILRQIIQGDRI